MNSSKISLKQLAKKLNLEFSGDGNFKITHACGLDSLNEGGLAYITNPEGIKSVPIPAGMSKKIYSKLDELDPKKIAFIVSPETITSEHNLIFSKDPLASHVNATNIIHNTETKMPGLTKKNQIHQSSFLSNNSKLGRNVTIGPKVVIYDDVEIGDNTILHSGVIIMTGSTIGKNCTLFPNVVIQERSIIGDRVILQSCSVIGSDGHGYFQRDGVNKKIPQIGNVHIEDDVEVGACTTIDRARFNTTLVKKGSKLDNQVQIAHNVILGEQALISAQSAIGGSVKAGDQLIMGGQSGIRDNVEIGQNVTVIARAVITSKTKDKEVLGGMPGRPLKEWRTLQSLINRLSELFERVRNLESKIINKSDL